MWFDEGVWVVLGLGLGFFIVDCIVCVLEYLVELKSCEGYGMDFCVVIFLVDVVEV